MAGKRGNLLSRTIQNFEKKIGVDNICNGAVDDGSSRISALKVYKDRLGAGEAFQVQFAMCGTDGTLSFIDENGIYVIMEAKSTLEGLPYFKPRISAKLLDYVFDVRVASIDEENGKVFIVSAHDGKTRTVTDKSILTRELIHSTERKIYPKIWGRVASVKDDKAFVDILGYGIFGIVDIRHWQNAFVRNMSDVCRVDEFYQFEVTHACKKRQGKPQAFLLDRRNIAGNPWDDLPKELIREGAVCKVTALELPTGKSYWWGQLSLARGIEVMGNYSGQNKGLYIVPSLSYKCKVVEVHINEEGRKNMLKVSPFAIAEEDTGRYKTYLQNRFLKESDLLAAETSEPAAASEPEGE